MVYFLLYLFVSFCMLFTILSVMYLGTYEFNTTFKDDLKCFVLASFCWPLLCLAAFSKYIYKALSSRIKARGESNAK